MTTSHVTCEVVGTRPSVASLVYKEKLIYHESDVVATPEVDLGRNRCVM